MIVTHTQSAQGQRRLYLGGKSSLECWIEPDEDGTHWQFNALDAVTGNDLSDDERRACMTRYLLGLARELGISAAGVGPDALRGTGRHAHQQPLGLPPRCHAAIEDRGAWIYGNDSEHSPPRNRLREPRY